MLRFGLADHSRVRTGFYKRHGRVAVKAESESMDDIPEYKVLYHSGLELLPLCLLAQVIPILAFAQLRERRISTVDISLISFITKLILSSIFKLLPLPRIRR